MGRRWRKAAWRRWAVLVTVAMVVPVASGIAAATRASAVPAKLVGVWSRNVTQANWNKYGQGRAGFPVGVWSIVIKKNGDVEFYVPGSYVTGCKACVPDVVTDFTIRATSLTVGPVPVCSTKGIYSWKVSGRLLTLRAIADKKCGAREALLSGLWKRK